MLISTPDPNGDDLWRALTHALAAKLAVSIGRYATPDVGGERPSAEQQLIAIALAFLAVFLSLALHSL